MNAKLKKLFGYKPIVWVPMWALSKLRKRGGGFAGEISGNTLWYDQWYERAMSRENAEKLSALGINLVVLPFSLGASAEAEREERDDFEKMTSHLHQVGIASLAYLQYQNVLQEENVPEGAVWAEHLNGQPQQYCYWRRTVCQSSSGFINYFKQAFSNAIARGADGVWIDNNYLHPCRCESCVEKFIEYLEDNRGHLLDTLYLKDFSNIAIPASLSEVDDPIVQAFIDFNCKRNNNILLELKNHLETVSKNAVFASNPTLFRGNSYGDRGIDFYHMFQINDLIYLENKFFPEEKNGQVSGNYHGFVVGDALGTPAISGAWKKADFDSISGNLTSGLPETEAEIERALLESPTFGGMPGAFWAVRNVPQALCDNAEDQLKMYYELPTIHKAMRDTLAYVQALPVFGERRNLAEIAVMYHGNSLKLDFDAHYAALHGIEELLMTSGLPYNILHSSDMRNGIEEYRLLILPSVRLLSETEFMVLEEYVQNGGRILILGRDCGLFNESRRSRLDSIMQKLSGASCFGNLTTPFYNRYGQGMTVVVNGSGVRDTDYINMMCATPNSKSAPNWLKEPTRILVAIDKLLDHKRQIKLEAKSRIAVSIAEINGSSIAVQLFSYAGDTMPEPVTLQLDFYIKEPVGSICRCCTLYRLGRAPEKISLGSGNRCTIPDFRRHAALIFYKNR